LFSDEKFVAVTNVNHMKPRKSVEAENYLVDKVNNLISNSDSRFTKESAKKLLNTAGFDWDFLTSQAKNNDGTKNEDLVKAFAIDKAKRISQDHDVKEIADALL